MSTYDPDNIFAKIIEGTIPCHKIYEDDDVLAFMDVMPQTKGHALVVPKKGSRNLLDATPETLATTIQRTQTIANAVKNSLNADGIRIAQFNEAAAGQTVFHLHIHIIPTYDGQEIRPHTGELADSAELAALAERIKAAL